MTRQPEQPDQEIPAALKQLAGEYLDESSETLDAATLDALAAARARARMNAAGSPMPAAGKRLALWWGAGTALAAGIATLVVLPQQPANSPERLLAEPDVVLVSDADADVVDNLAFVSWLEDKANDSI